MRIPVYLDNLPRAFVCRLDSEIGRALRVVEDDPGRKATITIAFVVQHDGGENGKTQIAYKMKSAQTDRDEIVTGILEDGGQLELFEPEAFAAVGDFAAAVAAVGGEDDDGSL